MKARSLVAGKHADGQGLWLFKQRRDGGKWILRFVIGGRRREMGLGRWPDVSIAEARERASAARRLVRDGLDPINERQKKKLAQRKLTVAEAIDGCFTARQAELKGDDLAGRWMSPLSTHIIPKIGKLPVEDIDQHVLKSVLQPIWHEKPDVARKAMNRINLTLKHAAALGLYVDLQATMKARVLLGKQRHEPQHIPSLPYQEMPYFYAWLRSKDTVAAVALRFLILTAARTSEVRFARFEEIDIGVWSIIAARTKTGQDHRIPLSGEALSCLSFSPSSSGDLLFPTRTGKPLSDAAMAMLMKPEGYEARPHGFRASFRTWLEEQTDAPYEAKELALGHRVGNDTVRAYQRSDHLETRMPLMEAWADFLTGSRTMRDG
ncbi:MAG: integrase arm-type DNA-binding domain-containing protein [Pseudomonadota bacterium]